MDEREKNVYLAHMDGKREQTVKEHLEGTAELAGKFAAVFGKEDWGCCCGILHDVGKYSAGFQKRIRGESSRPVDHSTAGAQLCLEKGGMYAFLSYCVAGHHTGLPDRGSSSDQAGSPTLEGRRRKEIEDFQDYGKEIQIPDLTTLPFDGKRPDNPDFSMSVLIRMLYSCLVDADFLDTERFMRKGQTERKRGESLEVLLGRLEAYISGWLSNDQPDTVNGRRTEILKRCLECGDLEKGLFRLTVPTGGGKTVASLAFALRHGVKHHMRRVIYVIPYTSIIEQNAQVFREILGEENVLENHCNVDYESSEEFKPMQLAAENWDKPVIVTTNVQFFESLFASRPSKCRKLHNIADSVVVFDEAQMLPLDYLKPCISMIEDLIRFYGVSAVLCTATQPSLEPFFGGGRKGMELCPRMEEQFRFFERTTFQNLGTVAEEELAERLGRGRQVLCIVNTRKRAQQLYRKLKGEGVYHLSTTMYPVHRRRILETIRSRLKDGKPCILISTSLVEAGVDLDFQSVYRQLSGVDSMIQAAGRCNREGKRSREESKVFIFQFDEKESAPGQRQQIDISENLLAEGRELSSLDSVEEYFRRLYHFRGAGLDKKKIMEEFKRSVYNFDKVGKEFRLIEEHTRLLFVGKEEKGKALLEEIRDCGCTKERMRKVTRYCVQMGREFDALYGAGMIRAVSGDMEDFYELTDQSQYTEELGLNLEVDSGMAMFL